MNTDDIYPGKYLKAADIDEGGMTVTIEDFAMEELGRPPEQKQKPVVYFKECKPMVCNKTNKNTLAALLGKETDDWIGQQVELTVMMVNYGSDVVPGIRVQPFRKPIPPEAEGGTRDEINF